MMGDHRFRLMAYGFVLGSGAFVMCAFVMPERPLAAISITAAAAVAATTCALAAGRRP